ncbi:hypothetical protein MC885_015767 [Smutsia gigantea]|nr:hypothetical protein MC885_015767 [Smutsia gigantea]
MAAALLLRQGRAGALKTLVLEARVFRGLAPTVSFSAESGKSGKGLPLNPKNQNSSKNVVEPKERGKLLATSTAAELSKNLPSPSSNLSVVNPGGKVAGPGPEDSMLFADEGVLKFMSRKTLVEFPQKVPSPFRKQEPTQAATPAGTFDNTTYRNLQHHDYSTYTFLDLNLDLTKFRMPQPSSGRESPRH